MSKVLYIMSGPSCAGKSTWIKENFKDVEDVEMYKEVKKGL